VKNAIIQVDATPFKQWYQTHYGVELGNKGKTTEVAPVTVRQDSDGTGWPSYREGAEPGHARQ